MLVENFTMVICYSLLNVIRNVIGTFPATFTLHMWVAYFVYLYLEMVGLFSDNKKMYNIVKYVYLPLKICLIICIFICTYYRIACLRIINKYNYVYNYILKYVSYRSINLLELLTWLELLFPCYWILFLKDWFIS